MSNLAFNEVLDKKMLSKCISLWESLPWTRKIGANEKEKAMKLLSETSDDGRHPCKYQDSNLPFYGRSFVEGIGLQNICHEIRQTITSNLYNDYDIVNCQPSILCLLIMNNGLHCPNLEDYCEHREEWLKELMDAHGCSRDDAKKSIITAINGGDMFYKTNKTIALDEELKRFQQILFNDEEFSCIANFVKGQNKEKPIGSFMSYLLQNFEAQCLECAINFLQSKEIPIDSLVLIFDGFMLKKEYTFDIAELNAYIFSAMKIEISFINKPMKDHFVLGQSDIKIKMKPASPAISISTTDKLTHIDFRYVQSLTKKQIIKNKEGNDVETTVDDIKKIVDYLNQYLIFVQIGKSFVIEITDLAPQGFIFHTKTRGLKDDVFAPIYHQYHAWIFSPRRRVVHRITYVPYLVAPPVIDSDSFNLFRGFKHTKKSAFDTNFKVNMELVNPWIDMIRHNWCSDDAAIFDYVIKWFAHKIQRPDQKVLSTIVITSILEGIGKNTFFEFFNHRVIGSEFGILLGSMEELMSKFNDQFEMSLVICCDELKNKGNKFEFVEQLKKLLTQTQRNIETKFMAVRKNCPDYNDYIFFTNNWGVIKPSMSDRRYFCLEGNCDRANNQDYWNDLYQYMTDEAGLHFFYYLAKLDLSEYNPRKIPMTPWKRELKEMSIDPCIKAIIKYIVHFDKSGTEDKNLHLISDMYDFLDNKMKINSRSFSVSAHKMLMIETKQTEIDSKKGRFFVTSIPLLKEKIRGILKDPEYPFVYEDEEENNDKEDDKTPPYPVTGLEQK